MYKYMVTMTVLINEHEVGTRMPKKYAWQMDCNGGVWLVARARADDAGRR